MEAGPERVSGASAPEEEDQDSPLVGLRSGESYNCVVGYDDALVVRVTSVFRSSSLELARKTPAAEAAL